MRASYDSVNLSFHRKEKRINFTKEKRNVTSTGNASESVNKTSLSNYWLHKSADLILPLNLTLLFVLSFHTSKQARCLKGIPKWENTTRISMTL